MSSDEIFFTGFVIGALFAWAIIRFDRYIRTLDEPEVDDDRW